MAKVTLFKKSITNANLLSVQAGSTGPQGGNHSHGGVTVLRLQDEGATAWKVRVDGQTFKQPTTIEIVLGGDSEGRTFVDALEFALTILKEKLKSEDSLLPNEEELSLY